MSRHRASSPRRPWRAVALTFAVAATLVIGGVATGLVPGLPGTAAAPVSAAPTAIETAALDVIEAAAPGEPAAAAVSAPPPAPEVPANSGTGRRIVFDQGDQRVWLVGSDGRVARTYLVSGSRFDNLRPGNYAVQSKTRHATAFDGSGTMEYFVRFATGFSEPIGFHSVPVDRQGRLEQTKAQLGTPLSAGCVRQWKPDAIALWEFASLGTRVVVTA